jgi:hypothetical protein
MLNPSRPDKSVLFDPSPADIGTRSEVKFPFRGRSVGLVCLGNQGVYGRISTPRGLKSTLWNFLLCSVPRIFLMRNWVFISTSLEM